MLTRNITKITNDSFKRLNEDVNKLLLEDIDAVKKVFMNRFSDMSDEEFDEIIELDPTYKEGSNSVGKYGKWLLGLYKKDYPLDHPLYSMEDIYNILDMYNEYKNDRKKDIEKDINKFKSIEDLADALRNAGDAELSARQKERELRNSKDIKKIFEDSKWEIWVPQSYAGSCTLGKGTEWCTAYSENDSYYNDYTSQGPLYVFINKQNPKEKYQLHVETESFMNKDDYKANLADVLSTDDKLRGFVYRDIYGYKIDKDGNFIYDGENKIPEGAISVIIEQGVTSIDAEAFDYCTSLQSITIPDSVTSIGDKAFFHCTSLQSITIPDSVTSIGEYAFDSCISLQSVTILDSVTSIGEKAFWCCTSLQSIVIPNSVTSIGRAAFGFCKSLQSITIPDSVTSIGKAAFSTCESLQSIHIPHSVRVIDEGVFIACKSLQSVTIPDSVTSINDDAFSVCESLQSITIPDSVTSIGNGAFWFCKSLQSITIPDSVTSIGKAAFNECGNLTKVILENPNTEYEDNTFPEHTKIIKKGVNENMKIKTNESINLKRAKRVLENNGYKLKSTRRVNNMREDALDDVGTFRITMKDAETKYADVPFKVKGNEGEIDRIIYGDEFGDYFDENEIFTIASQPGKMHQLVKRAYMATNESINLIRAKRLLENNGYIVTKKGLKESSNSKNFLCEFKGGLYEGEQFFVEAENYEEAVKIAHKVDSKVYVYKKTFTDLAVELSGLDVL